MIQVDLDGPTKLISASVSPGDRMWIEGRKQGQVVGVLEATVGDEGWSDSDLERVVAAFSDVAVDSRDAIPDELLPKASIVVPTICQRPAELVRAIHSLLDSNYPDFEIIVVDNRFGSNIGPLPDFSADARVRVEAEPKRGISAARNRGIAMASGEFIAFTDDDVVVDQNWLRALASRFVRNDDVEAIGGLVLPMELETPAQLWFEEFYGGFSQSFRVEILSLRLLQGTDKLFPYAPGRFGAGCNMAFRHSTLLRLGGFDTVLGTGTPTRGGEDLTLFFDLIMAGGTAAFDPAAMVRHSHRRSEVEFLRQVYGYGTGLTAMYSAWIVKDPRHLAAMIRRVPDGLRLLIRPREDRSPSSASSYPRRTLAYQLLGMLGGPLAFARSFARDRRSA